MSWLLTKGTSIVLPISAWNSSKPNTPGKHYGVAQILSPTVHEVRAVSWFGLFRWPSWDSWCLPEFFCFPCSPLIAFKWKPHVNIHCGAWYIFSNIQISKLGKTRCLKFIIFIVRNGERSTCKVSYFWPTVIYVPYIKRAAMTFSRNDYKSRNVVIISQWSVSEFDWVCDYL